MNQKILVLSSITRNSKSTGKQFTLAVIRLDGQIMKIFSDVPLDEYVDTELDVKLRFNDEGRLSVESVSVK